MRQKKKKKNPASSRNDANALRQRLVTMSQRNEALEKAYVELLDQRSYMMSVVGAVAIENEGTFSVAKATLHEIDPKAQLNSRHEDDRIVFEYVPAPPTFDVSKIKGTPVDAETAKVIQEGAVLATPEPPSPDAKTAG